MEGCDAPDCNRNRELRRHNNDYVERSLIYYEVEPQAYILKLFVAICIIGFASKVAILLLGILLNLLFSICIKLI